MKRRFTAVRGNRAPARMLLEAATESEWVARHLESLGHMVIVADPNVAPMYATRRRGVKTDRRDARTLAEAVRLGAYRAIHRASAAQRHGRAQLVVQDALIRTHTRYVNVVRALTRRDGLRLPSGGPEHLEAQARGAAVAGPPGRRRSFGSPPAPTRQSLVTGERVQKAERHLEGHRLKRAARGPTIDERHNPTERPGLTGCAASQKAVGLRRP